MLFPLSCLRKEYEVGKLKKLVIKNLAGFGNLPGLMKNCSTWLLRFWFPYFGKLKGVI